MSYDHWKCTEPEPQDGLQQCPQCGKLTDALYAMEYVDNTWREVDFHFAGFHAFSGDYFCYKCCGELEGGE